MSIVMRGAMSLNIEYHRLAYRHVDVFSKIPFSGNGLTVFPDSNGVSVQLMQRITQELRQSESIFLNVQPSSSLIRAPIFTREEELNLAGHHVPGAACVARDHR